MKRIFLYFCFSFLALPALAQLKPVYNFQADDSLLKKRIYESAAADNKNLLAAIGKEYKDDYKEVYESRFKEVSALLKSSRTVADLKVHAYLQTILSKIIDANPELKALSIRLVFSRDWWPNAYSMGEGTLAVNAGLMVFLDSEAELVFVLCHELAHLYLDHGNSAIKKNIETINSQAFKDEIKRISKQEYRIGEQLENLVKTLSFGNRRHSRENEAEADRQAFKFMRRTSYDCNAAITCLQTMSKMDDSTIYKSINPEQVFNFTLYPFKKKWIQNQSSIFSQMSEEDSPLTQKEKDSLRTHPDCAKRIQLLQDSIAVVPAGKKFIADENLFRQLKKDFFIEMAEQEYRDENITRNLYYGIQLLQSSEYEPFAVYSIARDLNILYEKQKEHKIGIVTEKETRGYPADYNTLLRMIDRLRLEDIAAISYFFCRQYKEQMQEYKGFKEEWEKADKRRSEYQF